MSGTTWKTIRTPSTVRCWPVRRMWVVGRTMPTRPVDVPGPRPTLAWPRGPVGSAEPYMNAARRCIAGPA
ncbi:hypothetical protein GCM10027174_15730 [Salinifilum aidingensis]